MTARPSLTVAEVAAACNVSPKTVRALVRRGQLAGYKVAARVRIRESGAPRRISPVLRSGGETGTGPAAWPDPGRSWPIENVRASPQLPPRQDSLADQLRDLHVIASRIGCYDAADWLWKHGIRGAATTPRVEDLEHALTWALGYIGQEIQPDTTRPVTLAPGGCEARPPPRRGRLNAPVERQRANSRLTA